MPKTKISEFDVDPANNTDINSINIAEGCAPSGINNAIRQLMSDLKEQLTGASGDPFTVGGAFAANGGATLGDASGDALTINSSAVSIPNGLNFDSNTFVIDAANNNVGIGTSSPAQKLDVQAATCVGKFTSTTGTNAVYTQMVNTGGSFYLGTDDSAGATSGAAYGRFVYGTGAYPMIFFTNATERMRIDSSGNVGIGTSSPTNPGSFGCVLNIDNAGGSALYLSDDGSVGQVSMFGTSMSINNRANGATLFSTNATERMRIDSSGNLLVGTTNATSNSGVGIKFVQSPTDPFVAVVASTNASGSTAYNLYSTATSSYRFYVSTSGTISAVNTTISSLSDQRHKENIRDLDVGIEEIMALKPRKFDWKEGKGKDIKGDRGFIAQEFEQVFPELIDEWKDPAPEGEEPYKSVRADLIPVLVKAMQEQQAIINDLKARIETLESK